MPEETRYMLVRDDDAHWYIIPADKEEVWDDYLVDFAMFDADNEADEPEQPNWAIPLGGGAESVKFTNYVIE